MIKERKLSEYYHFKINLLNGYVRLTDMGGNDLPDYKKKLTKGQWAKAKKYLMRELIPFSGYHYAVKEEHKDKTIITIK